MTKRQSGHKPAGMDRLTKNLITKCNRYCADLQWLLGFCLTDSGAIVCGVLGLMGAMI